LLRNAATWQDVQIYPNGGAGAAIAYLIGRDCDIVASKLRIAPVAAPLVMVMNVLAWGLDGLQARLRPESQAGLAPNYLAVAVR
jgi:hypothetical protein